MQSSDLRLFAKAVETFQHRRDDDAERDFKKILRKEPSHVGALSLYAVLLMQWGRLEEAESSLRRASHVNAKSDVAFKRQQEASTPSANQSRS